MNRIEIELARPYWSLVYNASDKTVYDGYLGYLKVFASHSADKFTASFNLNNKGYL
jgi:hypothetical protein